MRCAPERWEYGSQPFWLDWEPGGDLGVRPWDRGGEHFASGRDALVSVVAAGGWRRLWVPSYLCQEVVAALQHVDIELRAYPDSPVDPGPHLPALGAGDAVLAVNTFGLRGRRDRPRGDVGWIEDHTHSPLSAWAASSRADYCVASLRKQLPIPDGGVAWSPVGRAVPAPAGVTPQRELAAMARLSGYVQKALFLAGHPVDKDAFRAVLDLGEERFGGGPASAMTSVSRALLGAFPLGDWQRQHRALFARFAATLTGSFDLLQPEPEADTPFCAALVFATAAERDRVRSHLIANRVYPSALWPLDEPRLDGVPAEHGALSRRMFVLPCDVRYSEADVDRVVALVHDAGEGA